MRNRCAEADNREVRWIKVDQLSAISDNNHNDNDNMPFYHYYHHYSFCFRNNFKTNNFEIFT